MKMLLQRCFQGKQVSQARSRHQSRQVQERLLQMWLWPQLRACSQYLPSMYGHERHFQWAARHFECVTASFVLRGGVRNRILLAVSNVPLGFQWEIPQARCTA